MAWEQLAIDKPHLAYIIIGGFTSLFMLCSLFVKERLYIGEATVATICGVIFGPHAANLFNPMEWGNTDKITLECSRIVLVVQCFAVGVELPKAYMERHWRSVTFLLVPVMTFGWLATSLFIWWMIVPLTWLESLAVAACVTATDPVLASSVVGKGKFAKRVPKHLRDVLSAESGCNDGMAFPFIYLSLYLIRYHLQAKDVVFHWACLTILYECIFGAVYGFTVGYIGRHAIKFADRKGLIDRESFLVFYFVLALFCAGSGSLLGLDDLLVGFAAGVGFSNDGWFTQKTEEAHVSNVIDLLLNLAYFVYLGSIIPWEQYNNPDIGLTPWKLVVIAIMVILFRRIPIMLALKPIIPDVKNWREALFAGHFGPIGVGAIFAAILTRAELESDSTQPLPLAEIPKPGAENYLIVQLIWPVTTFLVISSILVHGSSIAVFTLGKRINTLTLTMSYTQANEPSWMNRLPRITSTSRSMSKGKADSESTDESDEKLPQFPPGTLPPVGLPGNFLRRQKEDESGSGPNSRNSSLKPPNKRRRQSGRGAGGPISQSAISPQWRSNPATRSGSPVDDNASPEADDRAGKEEVPSDAEKQEHVDAEDNMKDGDSQEESEIEVYQEGHSLVVEDEEGNVLDVADTRGQTAEEVKQRVLRDRERLRAETSGEHAKDKHHPHTKDEGSIAEHALFDGIEHPSHPYRHLRKRLGDWSSWKRKEDEPKPVSEPRRGPAHAYQYGNTIIIENEDGEVVKKYDIPNRRKTRPECDNEEHHIKQGLRRMTTWTGRSSNEATGSGQGTEPSSSSSEKKRKSNADGDDDRIRFTLGGSSQRMNEKDFIKQIQSLDPRAQVKAVETSDAPEGVKHELQRNAGVGHAKSGVSGSSGRASKQPRVERVKSHEDRKAGNSGLALVDSEENDVPLHSFSNTLSHYSAGKPETAAARRRRLASRGDSDDDGTLRPPPIEDVRGGGSSTMRASPHGEANREDVETEAEKRRRLAALGEGEQDEDSDEDGRERQPKKGHKPVEEPTIRSPGIRFADAPAVSQGRVQWGEEFRGRPSGKK